MIPIVFRINFRDGSFLIYSKTFSGAELMMGLTPDYFARRIVTEGFGERHTTTTETRTIWHSPLNIDNVDWTEVNEQNL